MRTLTIAEINKMGAGEVIPRFEGRVEKLYDQRQGQGQYGTWYLQNMVVVDGENQITVTWGGAAPLSNLEGRICSFESSEGKHGMTGIKKTSRKVNDTLYEGVSLTESCKIRFLDQEEPKGVPNQEMDKPQGGYNLPAQPKSLDDGVTLARKYLQREANLYRLTTDSVYANLTDHIQTLIGMERMSGEMFDSICGRLYTAASKAGLGKGMPEKPL